MYQYMQRADIFDECAKLLQWWSGDGFPGNSLQNKLDKTRMTWKNNASEKQFSRAGSSVHENVIKGTVCTLTGCSLHTKSHWPRSRQYLCLMSILITVRNKGPRSLVFAMHSASKNRVHFGAFDLTLNATTMKWWYISFVHHTCESLRACMCACTMLCMCSIVYAPVRMPACMCACMPSLPTYLRVCVFACLRVCVSACLRACVPVWVGACVRAC